jgi:translation initiation factor IF-3
LKKSRHKPIRQAPVEIYPVNAQIRAPEVRLIDENGEFVAVTPTMEALNMAKERGFDLVLVSPKAIPPVAKIIDYGKFQYEQEKQMRKQRAKQKKVEVKGIRLSPRIGQHDIEVRLDQAENFLNGGDKVKVEIGLRGRERQHMDLAKEIINNFITAIGARMEVRVDEPLNIQGGHIMIVIAKK